VGEKGGRTYGDGCRDCLETVEEEQGGKNGGRGRLDVFLAVLRVALEVWQGRPEEGIVGLVCEGETTEVQEALDMVVLEMLGTQQTGDFVGVARSVEPVGDMD
jgi:hypothetical protein